MKNKREIIETGFRKGWSRVDNKVAVKMNGATIYTRICYFAFSLFAERQIIQTREIIARCSLAEVSAARANEREFQRVGSPWPFCRFTSAVSARFLIEGRPRKGETGARQSTENL